MTAADQSPPQTTNGHRTAVILDNDPFFRDFQAFLLHRRGIVAVWPESPDDYRLEWILAQQPSLIITEVLLPGTSGLDLVRALRKSENGSRHTPIIVYSVLQAEERALEAGANKYLHKPLMREGYLAAVLDAVKETI